MAETSAPQPAPSPHQASGSAVRVPASMDERVEINNQLTRDMVAAYLASETRGFGYGVSRPARAEQQ